MKDKIIVTLNNVPHGVNENEIEEAFARYGLRVIIWYWQKMDINGNDIITGEVQLTCEKHEDFKSLPTYYKLNHGRVIGIKHWGQERKAWNSDGNMWNKPPQGVNKEVVGGFGRTPQGYTENCTTVDVKKEDQKVGVSGRKEVGGFGIDFKTHTRLFVKGFKGTNRS